MLGYISDTLQATLVNGQISILDAILYVDPNVPILGCMDSTAFNFNPLANTSVIFGGASDNTIGNGGFFQFDQHQIFNASQECVIRSAKFYAENNKTITFELRDNSGVVLDDTTYNVSPGQQIIILNFDVPIGNDMQLGISSGNSDLYRNSSGANYPYNIGNVLTITGNSANEPGYYYFYYDIEIQIPCETNGPTTISETQKDKKEIIKVIDLLGRDVEINSNQPLFYIYKDGTVEKNIVIQ